MGRVALVVLVGVLVACGSNAAEAPTTTTASPTTPSNLATTPTVPAATTTTVAEAVDICPKGEVWSPGMVYVAECFVVPVAFEPLGDGWRSSGASGRWVSIRWVDPSDRDFTTELAIIAFESLEAPLAVLEEIASLEGLKPIGESVPVDVASRSGFFADFEGAPWQTGPEGEDPCNTLEPIRFAGDGNPIVSGVGARSDSIGVGYCDLARIWALEEGGMTVTIIGGTADPARHEEAVAKIEELIEGMQFDVGNGR